MFRVFDIETADSASILRWLESGGNNNAFLYLIEQSKRQAARIKALEKRLLTMEWDLR